MSADSRTFYTNVQVYGSKILYRGIENGKRVQFKEDYYPTLYVPSKNKTNYKDIHGQYLDEIKPGTIRECRDFVKQYENVQGFEIHGMQRYEYAYIADKFDGPIDDWDLQHINICNIDIEVGSNTYDTNPHKKVKIRKK